MANICKESNCNFVFPILDTEAMGNSLSSINFNFKSLDVEMCNVEDKANSEWNPAYTIFSTLSTNWLNAINIVANNSACWNESYTTMAESSAFWLKPITLVYPYPFNMNTTDIVAIQTWLNDNLPPKNGNCMNYIVGQSVIIHSPEYKTINRTITQTQNNGIRQVQFNYYCDCIGRGAYVGTATQNVNCGTTSFVGSLNDQFINRFVGIQFTVDSNFQWSNGIILF